MPADLEALLAKYGEAIRRAIAIVSRRAHLTRSDSEDFAQDTWVYLLKDDARAIRRFQGRSAPDTFFVRVATNILTDIRRSRDGHWRPSARARRLGPAARELETLIERDDFTPHEAVETVHARRGASYHDLESFVGQLQPWRRARPTQGHPAVAEAIDSHADLRASANPEQELINSALKGESERILNLIQRAWTVFTDDERLALADRFAEAGPHRPLQDFNEVSAVLRDLLASAGIQWLEVSAVLQESALDFGLEQLIEHEPPRRRQRRRKRARREQKRGRIGEERKGDE